MWLDTVQSQLESIVHFPESHSLSAENGEFSFEIRDKLLGPGARPSHRAVFSIQGDTIHVLTVRSGSQNALHPGDIEPPP
ncbi:MAG: hypothetical protein C0478_12860 [Planctomyces sp.]|nr:hypothetical protein [Planctomyces sp.]